MKTLTIIVGNSHKHTSYSILLGKLEACESRFGFMRIESDKGIFKWLRYPNRYMYIDLSDLSIHFLDGTVISGTTDGRYNADDTKVLTSGSLTDIIN
jgi:hypothetical protein